MSSPMPLFSSAPGASPRSSRRPSTVRALLAVALGASLLAAPARATEVFPAGSVIIPTTANFQDACGMVSAYGLVYTILRANDGLDFNPSVAGSPFQSRITVHWVYLGVKGSPNRCVPTNLDQPPTSSNATTSTDDPLWNDGCDIILTNTASVPVKVIDNTKSDASGDANIVTVDTCGADPGSLTRNSSNCPSSLGRALTFPNYYKRTVKFDATTATNVTKVRYGGGAFVISASDVPAFQALVSGAYTHKDTIGDNIDFLSFRKKTDSLGQTCQEGTTTVGSTSVATFLTQDSPSASVGFALRYANTHYVNLHRALVPFTADDSARMNGRPPRIALLGTVGGKFDPETAGVPASGIKGQQLKYYLKSAGLDFTSATGGSSGGGCQPDSYNVLFSTVDPGTGKLICPSGGKSGEIYDIVDGVDVAGGVLAKTDATGAPIYSVFWAPHFQQPSTAPAGCNAACLTAMLANISVFLGSRNRGFMGECATIGTLEGATGNYAALAGGSTQSLTCVQSGTSGSCDVTKGTQYGLDINNGSYINLRLDNCTDPTTANGVACIHYPSPGNAFAQVGDFRWYAFSGGTANYKPTVNDGTGQTAVYKPGTVTLAYTIGSNNRTTVLSSAAAARSLAKVDNYTFIQKDNNTSRAQVLYLGGHNYTSDVAGTRVALNTVLALGVVLSTSETAFIGPTLYNAKIYVPSYRRVTTLSAPIEWRVFNPLLGSKWVFPYHRGELRSHPLQTATGTTIDSFTTKVSEDASAVFPPPGKRNIFTYLGGVLSTTANGVPAGVPNGLAQLGWTPVKFSWEEITNRATCANNMRIGAVPASAVNLSDPTGYAFPHRPAAYAGMLSIGAYGDYPGGSICDLHEALEVNLSKADLGADLGASNASQTNIYNKLNDPDSYARAAELVSMVRGFCFANQNHIDTDDTALTGTIYYEPNLSQCNDSGQQINLNKLGGFVRSQAAIIPDSPYIANKNGKKRPTVLYVGGWDGQLHAFYVPRGDNLENGYTGPTVPVSTLTTAFGGGSAAQKFSQPLVSGSGAFDSSLTGLTELWSFIPPGQLPFLKDNSARVDSSPSVIDVFGDFDGGGIRTWHTVLIASAGGQNRELFALDITNPLDPQILWDIQSSFDSTVLPYAPVQLADDDTGFNAGCSAGNTNCLSTAESYQWQNRCTVASATKTQSVASPAPPCKPASYTLPPGTDLGRYSSGPFNYSHLGSSNSVSVAALRRNNAPTFTAFVATNEPGGNGIYVFAIDVVNGQKLWEWNNPYDVASLPAAQAAGVGNTPPAGVSLLSKAGTSLIDTAYVGDDTGNLWELDAADGLSFTSYANDLSCTDGTCNYALARAYGDGSHGAQPISTLSTIFNVPYTVPLTSPFSNYRGQTLLGFGTGGTDTVSSITPIPNGAVHLLPVAATGRYSSGQLTGSGGAALRTLVSTNGVGMEVSGFPRYLSNGERIFGSLVSTGDTLYVATAAGSVTDIDKRGDPGALTGASYSLSLNAPAATAVTTLNSGNGGAGGTPLTDTSVAGQVTVVTVTDQKIVTTVDKGAGTITVNSSAASSGINRPSANLLGYILRGAGRVY